MTRESDLQFPIVLVTGGAGFIGSNYVRYLLRSRSVAEIKVLDKLTYSGRRSTLQDLLEDERVSFIHGDICDAEVVSRSVSGVDAVVHFAAETHVDRSLMEAATFIETNVHGTWVLLEASLQAGVNRFLHVSTDEVYGAVPEGHSTEADRLHPRNPYSASKAAAEMMVISYIETFGLDAVISRGGNTYGPFQYPEKFIPLMITNLMEGRSVPIYGDGRQIRHWIHVDDHCSGIDTVLRRGTSGEIYNVGSDDERENIDVARNVASLMDAPSELLTHVADRQGHDRRYAMSCQKLRSLGWHPEWSFERGIESTISWYQERTDWWRSIRDSSFESYYDKNYGRRKSE